MMQMHNGADEATGSITSNKTTFEKIGQGRQQQRGGIKEEKDLEDAGSLAFSSDQIIKSKQALD